MAKVKQPLEENGIVGLASVLAGSIVTIMRIWDGVTDPFVGMMVDKTNGKFGKNRPFIVIGQIIMFATTFVMFNFIPKMGTGVRFVAFIIIYMIYIIGYTCQCVVTKSAQTCLTNDPKQRPIFAMCDTVYNISGGTEPRSGRHRGEVRRQPVRFLQPRPVHHHAADVRRPVCSVCSLRHHCSVA